jgi:hypothetical protein
VYRAEVIRTLTADEDVRMMGWQGLHIAEGTKPGEAPDSSYREAMTQLVAKRCSSRVTDVMLQLLDSTFELEELHVPRHLGFKPETRHALVSPTFDLLVGVFTRWVLETDLGVLEESAARPHRLSTGMFTAVDADFQGHVIGSSVVIFLSGYMHQSAWGQVTPCAQKGPKKNLRYFFIAFELSIVFCSP